MSQYSIIKEQTERLESSRGFQESPLLGKFDKFSGIRNSGDLDEPAVKEPRTSLKGVSGMPGLPLTNKNKLNKSSQDRSRKLKINRKEQPRAIDLYISKDLHPKAKKFKPKSKKIYKIDSKSIRTKIRQKRLKLPLGRTKVIQSRPKRPKKRSRFDHRRAKTADTKIDRGNFSKPISNELDITLPRNGTNKPTLPQRKHNFSIKRNLAYSFDHSHTRRVKTLRSAGATQQGRDGTFFDRSDGVSNSNNTRNLKSRDISLRSSKGESLTQTKLKQLKGRKRRKPGLAKLENFYRYAKPAKKSKYPKMTKMRLYRQRSYLKHRSHTANQLGRRRDGVRGVASPSVASYRSKGRSRTIDLRGSDSSGGGYNPVILPVYRNPYLSKNPAIHWLKKRCDRLKVEAEMTLIE